MSKRVTLTDRECEYIKLALEALKKETTLNYAVVETGRKAYDDIIAKLATP